MTLTLSSSLICRVIAFSTLSMQPMRIVLIPIRVFFCKFMAMLALGPSIFLGSRDSNTHGRSETPYHILAMGHGLKVSRINAAPHPAFVVDIETFRNWADESFEAHSMGGRHTRRTRRAIRSLYFHPSVSAAVAMPKPQPTSSFGNRNRKLHQAFCDRLIFRHLASFSRSFAESRCGAATLRGSFHCSAEVSA